MIRPLPILLALCPILFSAACKRAGTRTAESALRAVPPAHALPAPGPSAFLPAPLVAGGGATPISAALGLDAKAVAPDAAGRPWVAGGTATLAKPAVLNKAHVFAVLRPQSGVLQGLLAGGTRNWDNFLQVIQNPDGALAFNSENRAGKVSRCALAAASAPKPGEPWLLEIHPSGPNAVISVNGQKAGEVNGDIDANVFGAGYASNAPFRGQLGELRVYTDLDVAGQEAVRRHLLTWWGLAGGDTSGFADGFRHDGVIVGGTVRAATCGALTVVTEGAADATLCVGANATAPPVLDGLPDGVTVMCGRTWRVHSTAANPPMAWLSFDPAATIDASYLGEHGFYTLMFRDAATNAWREIGATSAGPDARITFSPVPMAAGQYTLAVAQGQVIQGNPARVIVAGHAPADEITVTPGDWLHLQCRGAVDGQLLTLTESRTGALWYSGPATALDLAMFAMRAPVVELRARFSAAAGVLAGDQKITLSLDTAKPALYPGLIVQIQRRKDADAALPPVDQDLATGARWPAELTSLAYPAFRTAESIHAPPVDDPAKPWWQAPGYFHNVLPSPAIMPDAVAAKGKLTAEESQLWLKQVAETRSFHRYPLGDIQAAYPVAIRIAGGLLINKPGPYQFQWESNLTSQLVIGGQRADAAGQLTIDCPTPGFIPFAAVMANSKDKPRLQSRLRWKVPGASAFTDVPAGAYVHAVDATRSAALAGVTKDFTHRRATLTATADDSAAERLLADTAVDKQIASSQAFDETIRPMLAGFMTGRALSGNPALGKSILDRVVARIDFLRLHPEQHGMQGFGKTDGRTMRLFESLVPFLALCENHPALQADALAARAGLAQYAIATCLSRSFFSEDHHGANDGYDDDNNLIVNFPRAARCLDDPYAWDAAACLQDSHFRYAPGGSEGLASDGMFNFHNVNGRQLHPLGYGTSWSNRVLNSHLYGTPWSRTAEQNHRMAEFHLAMEWIFYRGTQCWFANGRHNTHRGGGGWLAGIANNLLNVPGPFVRAEDRAALAAMAARLNKDPENSITGNRFFFRNLYMIHRRPDYYMDVKMTSPLAGPSESFAGQVPWNMGFADGVTTFMRDGKEYDALHSNNGPNAAYGVVTGFYKDPGKSGQIKQDGNPCLWQFRALPGTTKLDDETFAPDRYRGGSGSTAGGVSDGVLGHGAFHFALGSHGAEARKFYAFTDDGMVVLNSNISTLRKDKVPADVTLRSNLNQCDWKSDIRIVRQNGKVHVLPLASDNNSLTLPLDQRYWIEHDGIGYLVMPTGCEGGPGKPGTLRLHAATRTPLTPVPGLQYTPDQLALIKQATKPDRAAKVFHLWIDHGQQVIDAKAAYFVCMRAAMADVPAWLAYPPVVIHSNDAAVQAVTDRRDGTTHAFFREGGTLTSSDGKPMITTAAAAAIMWRPTTGSVTVQDPFAACTTDAAKLTDTLTATLGTGLQGITAPKELAVPLPGMNDPDDRHRGRPVTRKIVP